MWKFSLFIIVCLVLPHSFGRPKTTGYSSVNATVSSAIENITKPALSEGSEKLKSVYEAETIEPPPQPLKASSIQFSSISTDPPCGRYTKGKEMLQASVDGNTTLKWKSITATEGARCRISIAKDINNSKSAVVLMPSDGSADKSGTFECNRRADSYESKTVSFPSDFSCEQCILQYTWTTPNATYYGCADITVLPNQTKECPAVCLNGGVCSDGICLCVKSYYGPQCENKKNRDFAWLLLLLLSMLLLALGIGAISLLSSGKKEETKRLIGNENEMSMQDLRKEKPDPVVEREAGRKRDRPGELIGDACHNGHPLYLTKSEEGCPAGAFSCTNCGQVKKCNLGRWICDHCPVDYCTTCKPVKEMGGQRGPREEEKSGRPKDTRMAPDGMDDDLVRKVISSDQVQNIPQHRAESANGKIVWLKTHFIFMIDCSGSMKGSRWDSVKFGFNACLERLVPMKEVIVTGLTFDNKANLFCRECPPDQAIRQGRDMPFTGTGTNYKRCLEYAMGVITKTSHVDYLICMILLSDGLGGYPDRVIEELKDLKEQGKKFLFYSVACETEDDGDLMRMATELKGEHFKVESAEGIKKAFTNILGV